MQENLYVIRMIALLSIDPMLCYIRDDSID